MKAINIQWEVDDEKDLEFLPTELEIPKHIKDVDDISDYISDEMGFLHKGSNLSLSKEELAKTPLILCEGFQGDRCVMTLDGAKKEVYDIALSSDVDGFENYLRNNPNDTVYDFARFKSFCLEDSIINEYCYEYYGSKYCVLDDAEIEKLWDELTDVPFDESEYDLMLSDNWFIFEKGTKREDIWHWFDKYHSKGVGWLMNEYEKKF